jgi:hypothetical protein
LLQSEKTHLERTDIITVYLAGIRIDEPIVTITDLLVSLACFVFSYRMHTQANQNRAIYLFKLYFLSMGAATLFGGLFGHAFLYALGMYWKLPGWIISMLSIMLIERAVINHAGLLFNQKVIKALQVINIVELLIFMFLSIYFLNFFFVEFHSGYGLMFVVLGLEGYLYFKTKNQASKLILFGIASAALAAFAFMSKTDIHPWFNHIAVSHVFLFSAALFFYQGARRIELNQ